MASSSPKSSTKTAEIIPEINLCEPEAKHLIVNASEEFGFFKVINHGINMDLISKLESEAMGFFSMEQEEKEKARPIFGSKNIGQNGDAGWLEYLIVSTNPDNLDFRSSSESFRCGLREYFLEMKKMSRRILELMADGLKVQPRQLLSSFVMDEESDSKLRINHYPPRITDQHETAEENGNVGFGEHTDPQMISILRANQVAGYEIMLRDSTWVSIPPDQNAFFINIGDCLQVMTNGKFPSVRHRVLANKGNISRLSMVFFAAPATRQKIGPMPYLIGAHQPSLYGEMTWLEYMTKARTKPLAYDRITFFQNTADT